MNTRLPALTRSSCGVRSSSANDQCGVLPGAGVVVGALAGGLTTGDGGGAAAGCDVLEAISFCTRSCCCLARFCAALPGCAYCTALLADSSASGYCFNLSCATESLKYSTASGVALLWSMAFCRFVTAEA